MERAAGGRGASGASGLGGAGGRLCGVWPDEIPIPHATVLNSPGAGAGTVKPAFSSTNDPVPYVFLPIPGSVHAWPNSAACWSPATPATGTAWPCKASGRVTPSTPALARTSGSARAGTPKSSNSSGSQRPAAMSNSIVRDAFEGSVTYSPVSLYTSHESTVPNTARPPRARSRKPSTCSSSHSILLAEK